MKRTFATFAAVTALALGACGAPAEDEAAATSTVTQHVTAEKPPRHRLRRSRLTMPPRTPAQKPHQRTTPELPKSPDNQSSLSKPWRSSSR